MEVPNRSIRIIGSDPVLGAWLGAEFNRHLTSVSDGIGWSESEHTIAPVEFDLDLADGFRSTAADVSVEITGPIERFLTRNDEYDLGGTPNILSTVWIPCRDGVISVGGHRLSGAVTVDPVQRCRVRSSPTRRCGARQIILGGNHPGEHQHIRQP